jgi:hypothetical protein
MNVQSHSELCRWCEFRRTLVAPVSWKGFVCSAVLPALWVAFFYAFVIHVWFSLGRWPKFGEPVEGILELHLSGVFKLMTGLVLSLYAVPVICLLCLFFRRWRHISLYLICYAAAVGAAFLSISLAPHSFRNWFFD